MSGLPAAEQPTEAEVTVTATRYSVSGVPDREGWRWPLTVERRRDGWWTATDHDRGWLDADGYWRSGVVAACLLDEATALRVASTAASHVVVNGITVADAIARSKEQP